jgi:hypothetical protein
MLWKIKEDLPLANPGIRNFVGYLPLANPNIQTKKFKVKKRIFQWEIPMIF